MNEDTRFTVDGKEIVKDLKVWVCPLYDSGMSLTDLRKWQNEYIVIETLNSCDVYTKNKKGGYPTFHFQEVFSTEEQARKQRIINLGKILDREKAILKSMVTVQSLKISEIRLFQDELIMKLGH